MRIASAKGALLRSAWGNAVGIIDQEGLSAESAYHEHHESRIQRSATISIQFPGATPQAGIESALSELNTSAVIDRRYSFYAAASNSKAAAFSLVEIVLALGVAAFCLIAIVGLMPVGVQTNRNATSQTAATNIMAAIVADLRATPTFNTSSTEFGITFRTNAPPLYFDGSGQFTTLPGANSRYQVNVTCNGTSELRYADLKVTWPAAATPANASGSTEMLVAFDRN